MSVKKRLFRNLGASAFAKLSNAVVSILSVPLFLHYLGVETYSVWLVLSTIPSWIALADIGFGSVTANEMALRASRGDWKGVESIFQSSLLAVLILSLLSASALVVIVFNFDVVSLLNLSSASKTTIKISILLLGLSSIIALQGALFGGLFRAKNRADVGIGLTAVRPLMDITFIFIALNVNNTVVSASSALLLSQIIYVSLGMLWGLKTCKEVKFGVGAFNQYDFKYCMRKGLLLCALPLGNALVMQGMTIMVNMLLGATSVVLFNSCRTLTRSAQQILNLIGQSVWSEFSTLIGMENLSKARDLFRITCLVNLSWALLAIFGILLVGPQIFSLWTGRMVPIDRWILAAYCLGIFTNSIWFAPSVIVSAVNQHESYAKMYFLGSMAFIPIGYFAVKYGAIYGAALSPLIIDIFIIPILIKKSFSILHETPSTFYSGSLYMIRMFLSIGRFKFIK